MPTPKITITETTDAGEHLVYIERDSTPVFGVVAEENGAVSVGYWINGETWKLLHTIDPE